MNQKGNILIYLLAGLLVLTLVGAVLYFKPWKLLNKSISPKACTMEAKECPDGSFVGRTGSNCEFSPCLVNTSR